ncbi:MAG: four helix bundle protein [Proteobacteria bacterium]|nr:four helix bundle protein [Pseudomonadota bacterium]MBU2260308.1 four helix bundle protein [Pseudomonadota bacterium]
MSIEKFEDLVAWQKARELTRHIYHLTQKEKFSRDFGLREQVQRSSVSIMSNLAEGFERGSSSEFHQFIVIAKPSRLPTHHSLLGTRHSLLATHCSSLFPI